MGDHEVKRPAVFLDRDGVLNKTLLRDGIFVPPASVDDFEVTSDAAEGCAQLKAAGFVLIVVTNQPDVGRGTQNREAIEAMHAKLRAAVPVLEAIEVCYHAGENHGEPCDCRKPKPGMLFHASAHHGIDLRRSFLIGDRWRDIDCAHAAGCRAVFIDHGYSEPLRATPDFTVSTFREAVATILQNH
jgi:D-glycero-D-manno-heptose 1,7-bisphosphate phosphatase